MNLKSLPIRGVSWQQDHIIEQDELVKGVTQISINGWSASKFEDLELRIYKLNSLYILESTYHLI